MPVLPLNEAFTARAIKVMWDSYKQSQGIAPYLGGGFFPAEKTPTMDLKWFKGSKGLPVSLTPSNYDAQATVRDWFYVKSWYKLKRNFYVSSN